MESRSTKERGKQRRREERKDEKIVLDIYQSINYDFKALFFIGA